MKKAGIMQPYFFPYTGYFSLIKHTDEFILFDTAQFIRHGWIERNRILKQNEGWLYIKVPLLGHHRDSSIQDLRIDNDQPWRDRLLSQLQTYKRIAPNFGVISKLVEDTLNQPAEDIVTLNKLSLQAVCEYLSIKTPINIFSQMDLSVEQANAPDEWALNICKSLEDVSEYWNPPGGLEFFDKTKYDEAGIKLVFQKPTITEYDQKRVPFEPGLSIIDVLMFNTPEKVNEMLDAYELA